LQDSKTSATGWGPNLDIYLGDFTGSGHTEILLYDRVSGQIQILTLTPQLTIAKHIILPGWGPGWEVYAGQFDGQRTDLLLYNRLLGRWKLVNGSLWVTRKNGRRRILISRLWLFRHRCAFLQKAPGSIYTFLTG
jgi:hypothetical protein